MCILYHPDLQGDRSRLKLGTDQNQKYTCDNIINIINGMYNTRAFLFSKKRVMHTPATYTTKRCTEIRVPARKLYRSYFLNKR